MAKGSFNGLYTFQDVANIYNIDASTIRKQVQNHKFLDSEIRKFGKTWIITEQAMVEHFGKELFIAYKNNLLEQKALEIKRIKEEAKRAKEAEKEAKRKAKLEAKEILCLNDDDDDDDLPCESWEYEEVDERLVVKSFNFGIE